MVLSNVSIARQLLAVCASGLLLASAAHAQTAAPSASAFENYKPYTEEPVGNWRVANDNTAQIGGWRAYAKQAQGLESKPDNTPADAPKDMQSMPEHIKKAKP